MEKGADYDTSAFGSANLILKDQIECDNWLSRTNFGGLVMHRNLFNFRFDVDTELCLRRGVPNLLTVAANMGVRFTFFVNPGRAIRRRDAFGLPSGERSSVAKLPLREKMATFEIVRLLLRNPSTLPRHCKILSQASQLGHELGLHGGRNHGAWTRGIHYWRPDQIQEEVTFGMEAMRACSIDRPRAFASPGWATRPEIPGILADTGFDILADTHGEHEPISVDPVTGIRMINTSLCGEPLGVGYLESKRAEGLSDVEIEQELRRRLTSGPTFICLYDHPFFAGIYELELLERLISAAIDCGRDIVTLREAATAWEQNKKTAEY